MVRGLDVGIAHDQVTAIGGAERVAFRMARLFDAPIYAMAVDQRNVPDDVKAVNISSKAGTIAMTRHHLVQDTYQMVAWQHVPELYEHDVVVQNKTNPMWFEPRDHQTIVRYLHSTPRGLYDQFWHQGESVVSRLVKFPQRPLFRPNVDECDAWAANSDLVKRRAALYWGVDNVEVVYPPVDTDEYSRHDANDQSYYLVLSRLEGHKRVDRAVEAANEMGFTLKVAGDGSERSRLESMAGKTVEVLGYVDESEKRKLMSGAKAFLMTAENEDFGMTVIESMAAGTPVIGAAEGFTQHQIIEGKNGLLFDGSTRGLLTAVSRLEMSGVEWTAKEIEEFASQFSPERFDRGLLSVVQSAVENSEVVPPWKEPDTAKAEAPVREAAADGGDD